MMTRTLAGLTGLLMAAQAFAATPTPEEQYAQATAVLAQGCRGTGCDFGVETPEEQAALGAAWKATQDWTVAFLASHRGLDGEKLKTELLNRQNGVAPVAILPLKPGLSAVFAQYGEMGNVFLVAERDGHFTVVWDIRGADPAGFPILKSWRNDQNSGECRTHDDAWTGQCGPLFGNDIQLLPPDKKGRPRFYLSATYAQAAETTVGGQLSVWSLDGTNPHLQWAEKFAYNFEDVSSKRDGDRMKIRATDWWHTLFACGSCVGRQMDWTLRLRPDGIDDLGMKPVVPELDAFDALAWRVFQKKDASELASPAVIARMAANVRDAKAAIDELDQDHSLADYFSFGMLSGFAVRRVPGGRELCLATDDIGFRVRFERRKDRLFAVDLVQLPEPDSKFCHKQAD